jgi:hypothetical protein
MVLKETTDSLIATYKVAYEQANGKKLDSQITYENGWFVFRISFSGAFEKTYTRVWTRYRRAQLEQMRAGLIQRVS